MVRLGIDTVECLFYNAQGNSHVSALRLRKSRSLQVDIASISGLTVGKPDHQCPLKDRPVSRLSSRSQVRNSIIILQKGSESL